MTRTLAPYLPHLGFTLYIAAILSIDAQASRAMQALLGLATAGLLLVAVRPLSAEERRATWCCVAFSTAVELAATQLWGLYHYRLGNVPLYVPPGHGLIYVFALTAARTPLLRRLGAVRAITLCVAVAWAAIGLTGAGHPDFHGALYLPFFVAFVLRSPRAPIFAATFAVTSFIELYGVHAGTWHWSARMPGLGVPSGDPPSLIAGGYCCFGEVGLWLAGRLPRAATVRLTG